MKPTTHTSKTTYTLLALLALMLLLPRLTQAQTRIIPHLTRPSFTVQDGAQTIEVEGLAEFAVPDTASTAGSKHGEEIHIMSFSWDATSEAGRFDLEAGNAISRCERGTFKEASTETEGGRITVQRCSESEDPLTVSPVQFNFSGGTPETANKVHPVVQAGWDILSQAPLFEELDGQCFVDGAALFSLCLLASR